MLTLQQVKDAVINGLTVCYKQRDYVVFRDQIGIGPGGKTLYGDTIYVGHMHDESGEDWRSLEVFGEKDRKDFFVVMNDDREQYRPFQIKLGSGAYIEKDFYVKFDGVHPHDHRVPLPVWVRVMVCTSDRLAGAEEATQHAIDFLTMFEAFPYEKAQPVLVI